MMIEEEEVLIDHLEKCMTQFAQSVIRKRRFLSSHQATGRFIAGNAIRRRDQPDIDLVNVFLKTQ